MMHAPIPVYPWQQKAKSMGIGIAGASNSGKSTLAAALNEYLPGSKLIPEGVRELLKELKVEGSHHRMDSLQRFKFQETLLLRKKPQEEAEVKFVSDGTSLDICSYTLAHLAKEQSMQKQLIAFSQICTMHAQLVYDVIFVAQTGSVPFEMDGVRHQKDAWNLMVQLLTEQLIMSGRPIFHVHYLTANNTPDRVAECMEVIDKMAETKAKTYNDMSEQSGNVLDKEAVVSRLPN
jgi:nicotinamide riboside kinase